MSQQLPRGVWYEAPKRRFRVRKYRNRVVYLKGYYHTLPEALAALKELNDFLKTIPKSRQKSKASKPVTKPTLAGAADAIRERQNEDPNTMRRRKG